MRNIKCADCAEYRNEWCEKIIDSPYPDIIRDCQYWHERKDMVEVIRCRDCKHRYTDDCSMRFVEWIEWDDDGYMEYDDVVTDNTVDNGYCSDGKRREE